MVTYIWPNGSTMYFINNLSCFMVVYIGESWYARLGSGLDEMSGAFSGTELLITGCILFPHSIYTQWVNPEYCSNFNGIILPLATIKGHSCVSERWEYRRIYIALFSTLCLGFLSWPGHLGHPVCMTRISVNFKVYVLRPLCCFLDVARMYLAI